MKKIFLIIILIFNINIINAVENNNSNAKQEDNNFILAFHLLEGCKDYLKNTFNRLEQRTRKATCNGYFYGVGSTILILKKQGKLNTCIPQGISAEEIAQIFLEWTKYNLPELKKFSTEAVLISLEEHYKC